MKTTNQERRKHLRSLPPKRAIVHTSNTFGEICDISEGGFCLKYFETGEPLQPNDHVEIIMGGLSLSNVEVNVAWEDRCEADTKDDIVISRVGLEFSSLTPLQKAILDFFLSNEVAGTA